MRTGTTLSALLHIAVVLVAWLGLPSLMRDPIDLDQPMVVQVTTVAATSNPPPPAPPKAEPKPEPPKPEPPKPEPPRPEPKPEPPKPEPKPEPPKPEPPKPEPKPEPPKPEPEPLPAPKPKPEPPKPTAEEKPKFAEVTPKAKPKPPQDDFDSLLKTVERLKKPETQPPAPSKEQPQPQAAAKPSPTQTSTTDQPLSMSEKDAIRAQIERCWNVPAGAPNAETLVVEVQVLLNPDGSVTRADIVENPRYSSDGFYRAAAESAVRAVRRCSPLQVPPEKYDQWKSMTLTFNPKDLIYRR